MTAMKFKVAQIFLLLVIFSHCFYYIPSSMPKRKLTDLSQRQCQRIAANERTDFLRYHSRPQNSNSAQNGSISTSDNCHPVKKKKLVTSEHFQSLSRKSHYFNNKTKSSNDQSVRNLQIVNNPTVDIETKSLHVQSQFDFLLFKDSEKPQLEAKNTDVQVSTISVCQNEENKKFFRDDLARWAVNRKVEVTTTLTELLHILNKYIPELMLPSQGKTLLKTPRFTKVVPMDVGEYCHFGLAEGIVDYLKTVEFDENVDEIQVQIGTDGFPITKEKEGWPIMGRPINSKLVFLIGIYYGPSKPKSSNVFLRAFVDDAIKLVQEGLEYNGKRYKVSIHSLICDAPAKSFVLNTKGHTGYSSCPKCCVEGEIIDHRVCFAETDCTLRTDEGMSNLDYDDDYQMDYSILNEIPDFGLITNVPYDYMHLLCIGVLKKLTNLWQSSDNRHALILAANNRAIFSEYLLELNQYVPKEFCRRLRPLEHSQKWKATECRLALLYLFPVILNSVIDWNHDVMLNFLSLFISIRLFMTAKDQTKIDYASSLTLYFVDTFKQLFGEQFVSHNIHGIIHLVEDVKEFGTLECFSAFPFENFLRKLKALIRKSEKPLQQLYNRYCEMKNLSPQIPETESQKCREQRCHTNGPLVMGCRNPQYLRYYCDDFMLSTQIPDNCCQIDDDIVEISNFATMKNVGTVVIGKKFSVKEDLFKNPCSSSSLDIYRVKDLSNFQVWPVDQIRNKYVKVPLKTMKNYYAVVPLLHVQ